MMNSMRFLRFFCLIITATITLSVQASLTFDSSRQKLTLDIVQKLSERHYRELPIDDTLSGHFLDQLITNLDPAKSYFLASDVQEFEKFRHLMDDELRTGKLDAGLLIYERYQLRATQRLEWIESKLASPDFTFDFTVDESLPVEAKSLPWSISTATADDMWRKRLKAGALSLKLAGKTVDEAKQTLQKRYANQLKRLQQQNEDDIYESLINALTLLYDPHTNYFSPRTEENFNISMSLSLEGIGAVLQAEDDFTKVVRLITAGPADKQGELQPADRIVSVGQGDQGELVDVVGWRLDEVVDLIRGPSNTVVRLEVIPAKSPDQAHKTIKIRRGKVKLEEQAAQKAVIELGDGKDVYKMGVIRVPTFYMDFDAYQQRDPNYRSTTRDVVKLLQELSQENIDGLILDLRNNGGGSLQEATMLTDLFIDQGPVVQIRQSNQTISRHSQSRMKAMYRGPLIVLINRLSASASEIFAGAIQDYQRGLIVGSQSFGKGTVQSLTPLPEGRLKLTESKFYRVSGDSTQHRGVVPDIALPSMINTDEVGESTYDTALPWDQIHEVSHQRYFNFEAILPALNAQHLQRSEKDPDINHLLAQLKLFESLKSKDEISLNEATRLEEKKQIEQQEFTIANDHRVSKGMKPFATYEEFKVDETPPEDATDENESASKIDIDNDPLLHETGYILIDLVKLLKAPASAKSVAIN